MPSVVSCGCREDEEAISEDYSINNVVAVFIEVPCLVIIKANDYFSTKEGSLAGCAEKQL